MKRNILNYKQFIREFVDIENMTPIEKVTNATKNVIPQEYIEDAKAMDSQKEIEKEKKARKKEENEEDNDIDGKVVKPSVKPIG